MTLSIVAFSLQTFNVKTVQTDVPSCDCTGVPPEFHNVGPKCYLKGTPVGCTEGIKLKKQCVYINDDYSFCDCHDQVLSPCDPPPSL
jgi:hypothetical protein